MTISTKQLTNEELRQIIDSHEKGHCMVIRTNADYRMAKELLAVREAQSVPVASTTKSNIDAVLSGVSTVIWPVRCFKGKTHVDLYTAPPAPAPAVPAEMTADQMYQLLMEKGGVMSPVDAAVFAWNACRTSAMKNTPQAASQLAPSVDNGIMQNTPAGFKLVPAELLDAMAEVIRISDRDHEAWNRAKAAISACRAAKPVAPIEMTGALAMTKYGIKRSNYTQWVKGWNAHGAAMLQPVSQGYTLPLHVFRELVNSLRDTAVKYQGTQQLREQLSRTLSEAGLQAAAPTPTKAVKDER